MKITFLDVRTTFFFGTHLKKKEKICLCFYSLQFCKNISLILQYTLFFYFTCFILQTSFSCLEVAFRLRRSTIWLHLKHCPLTFCYGYGSLTSFLFLRSKVKNKNLYLATFASVLGPMSFGFVLGYSSPAIPELTSIDDPRLRLDGDQASWFGVWRRI